jgi:hypothetical protein
MILLRVKTSGGEDLFLKQWLRKEVLKQRVVSAVHSDFVLLSV